MGELAVILDTNALSAWAEDDRALLQVLPSDRPLYLPAIVLGEYRFGIKAARDRAARESWLQRLVISLTVLIINDDTSHHYADIREELRQAATPIPENDLWIAALARQHALHIVSRDAHFDRVAGLHRVSW